MKRGEIRKMKCTRKRVQRTPVESFRVQLAEKIHFFLFLLKQKTIKIVLCSITVRAKLLLGTTKIGILSRFMYIKSIKSTL